MQESILIDREGHWFMEGLPVVHHKIKALLQARLEIDSAGRHLIQLGPQTLWVKVEDAPFRVRRCRVEGERLVLALDDDSLESVEAQALFAGPNRELYAHVRQGRLTAKFERSAFLPLLPYLHDSCGQITLRLGDRVHPL